MLAWLEREVGWMDGYDEWERGKKYEKRVSQVGAVAMHLPS